MILNPFNPYPPPTPAIPLELWPFAARIPDTWVPWAFVGLLTSLLLLSKSQPLQSSISPLLSSSIPLPVLGSLTSV